jgi:hypothetical protein
MGWISQFVAFGREYGLFGSSLPWGRSFNTQNLCDFLSSSFPAFCDAKERHSRTMLQMLSSTVQRSSRYK